MSSLTLLRRFALDAILWACAPAAFLILYVQRYSYSVEAVPPHLRRIFLPLLCVAIIRLIVARSIANQTWARVIVAVPAALFLLTVLLYYSLVIIGLDAWGQVISWDLIRSYAIQAPDLADSLGISLLLVVGALVLLFAALYAVIWMYLKAFDWSVSFARSTSIGWCGFLVFSGVALMALELFVLSMSTSNSHSEPIGLTIFPKQANRAFESHIVDSATAARLDAIEDTARANYVAPESGNRKNLVLIVVDAFRPENMGLYGYARDTTPHLNALQQSGQLRAVVGARASCAESACGLFSLVTSKYVHQFSGRPFSLYQVLHKHGYGIHMILGGDHTNFYGLKQLYADADSYFDGANAKGYYINDDQFVVDRTRALPAWGGQPVMMQFHLMSAHTLGRRQGKAVKFSPAGNYMLPQNRGADGQEKIVNYYDNGVVQADLVIHDLLNALGQKGYLQNALVVVTADHGEALGEHGFYAHANGVREEVLRIPLAFIGYGAPPIGALRSAGSQIDIAPTILAELGIAQPSTWSGTPLQSTLTSDFTYFLQGLEFGLIDHRDPQNLWKYWLDRKTGKQYVFNLSTDPKENSNLIGSAAPSLKQEWLSRLLVLRPVEVVDQPAHSQ